MNMRYAQWKELRYCDRASSDCILVLITLQECTSMSVTGKKQKQGVDELERHSGVYRDKSSNATDEEGDSTRKSLTRSDSPLDELLQGRVCREPHSRVGSLSHHLRRVRKDS